MGPLTDNKGERSKIQAYGIDFSTRFQQVGCEFKNMSWPSKGSSGYGGGLRIRTLGGDKPSTVFKTAAFDRSASPPDTLTVTSYLHSKANAATRSERDYTVMKTGHNSWQSSCALTVILCSEVPCSMRREWFWTRAARIITGSWHAAITRWGRWVDRLAEQRPVRRGAFHDANRMRIHPRIIVGPAIGGNAGR